MPGSKCLEPAPADRECDAVCLGLNSVDHICLVSGFPERGAKQPMIDQLITGGGQAGTASCALARLGHRTAFVGVRGDDPAGERIRVWFNEYGVDISGLALKRGVGSQIGVIIAERKGGERTILWRRGQACSLQPEDVDPGLIASARVLHLDGHFMAASLKAARIAKQNGVLISMDAERIWPETKELISLCDLLMVCEDFAQRFCGIDDPERALKELAGLGPGWVGRTMGERGCEMYAQGRYYYQPAFKVEALDTTGAGDVFHAGMVHAVLTGQDPGEALKTASALAAISVTGLGGRSALPDRAGLAGFIKRQAGRDIP